MFCHKCGKQLPDSGAFCPYCGCKTAPAETPAAPKEKPRRKGFPKYAIGAALLLAVVLSLSLLIPRLLPADGESASPLAEQPSAATDIDQSSTTPEPPPETPETPLEEELPPEVEAVSLSDAVESVLYLEIFDESGEFLGSGSGFLALDSNTLITNYHVVQYAFELVAWTPDGTQYALADTLLAYDPIADLAILRLDSSLPGMLLPIADSDLLSQGDPVYAVGYPLGLANTISNGIVSAKYTDSYDIDLIQITAPISHGNSGGPLLNEMGHVAGVICAYYEGGQNLNLAIPSNLIMELYAERGGSVALSDWQDRPPMPGDEGFEDSVPEAEPENEPVPEPEHEKDTTPEPKPEPDANKEQNTKPEQDTGKEQDSKPAPDPDPKTESESKTKPLTISPEFHGRWRSYNSDENGNRGKANGDYYHIDVHSLTIQNSSPAAESPYPWDSIGFKMSLRLVDENSFTFSLSGGAVWTLTLRPDGTVLATAALNGTSHYILEKVDGDPCSGPLPIVSVPAYGTGYDTRNCTAYPDFQFVPDFGSIFGVSAQGTEEGTVKGKRTCIYIYAVDSLPCSAEECTRIYTDVLHRWQYYWYSHESTDDTQYFSRVPNVTLYLHNSDLGLRVEIVYP